MDERPHLFPSRTAKSQPYTYPRQVGSSAFKVPPRDDRVGHGKQLIANVEDAIAAAESATPAQQNRRGIVLVEFSSDVGFELAIESLEFRRSGIELLNSRTVDDVMIATVFIPEGKEKYFLKRFEAYCFENDGRSGKPKNQKLAESIQKIKLASIKSFWTDKPKQVLQNLGEVPVRMRVTLSYFIEPSPGRRGWDKKYRYQSHGLRFDVKRPLETVQEFQKRISKAAQEEDENITSGSDARNWDLGQNLQKKGSVHSDTWIGTAAELAECGILAVFPVTGWWKERNHLNGWKKRARYSLIVSIETDRVTADLYTPIAQQIQVAVESVIEV